MLRWLQRRFDKRRLTLLEAFVPEKEMRRRERQNLEAALRVSAWKIYGSGGAAELLGIKPTTLASRMKKFRLHKPR